jgi:hypothetical protein
MELLKATRPLLVGIALIAATSSGGAKTPAADVGVKNRANANASLAASGRFVALAWAGRTESGVTDIYFANSRDAGDTFSTPIRVNQVAGEASVSGEQPPQVTLVPRSGSDPSIVVVWTAKSAGGTRLLSARSDNGGRSFASPLPVPGGDGSGNRGWESIATDHEGHVVTLWLDHRELSTGAAAAAAADMAHNNHQHGASGGQPADGAARAQLSKLFFSRLDNSGSARAITGGVCYCCKTAVVAGDAGTVYAAWRHVYPGNVRDVAFTMSRDGGKTFDQPVRVSDDRWVLDGCPENGPAMAVSADHRIHVVWPTLVPGATPGSEPTLALFYANSQNGRQFTARQRIPTEGVPRHPQITLDPRGDVVVAWDEQASGSRGSALARGRVDGKGIATFVRQGLTDERSAVYPVVATTDAGPIAAWTSGTTGRTVIRTQRLAN